MRNVGKTRRETIMTKAKILFLALAFMALAQAGAVPCLPATTAHAQEGGEDANSGPPPDFEYLQLKPLNVPVITASGLSQQVSLLVSLEVPYGTKDKVKEMVPKLTDAYLRDLYGAFGSGEVMKGNDVDVNAVKRHLTEDTDKVLGPDKVHDVLLRAVQQFGR